MANASLRSRNVLTTILPKRYASSAPQQQSANKQVQRVLLQSEGLRVTKLPNGLTVASIENNSPITRLAAVVNFGARNESYEQQGAAHVLRLASGLATKNFTQYGLSRTVDHLGGQFSVTSGREQTYFNLVTARDKFERISPVLMEVVSRPLLKPWELEDIQERLSLELDNYDESTELRLADYIHKAAFRSGLSNSLYVNRSLIGNLDSDTLREFRERNVSADRITLVGVGVRHEVLLRHAEKYHLQKSASDERQPSRYLGTEIREDNTSDLVHVAVAVEGVGLSGKEALASAIVNHAFGTGPRVKWSDGSNRVANSVLPLATEPAGVSSFNVNYSDTGLFGFHLMTTANDAGKIVRGLFKECAKVGKNGFSNEEIANAKTRVKVALAQSLETSEGLVNSIGVYGASAANLNVEELARQVDAVSNTDVNNLAKRLVTSRPSLAAIGNLRNLPRLDELSA